MRAPSPMAAVLLSLSVLASCTERRPPASGPSATPAVLPPPALVVFETSRGEVPIRVEVVDTERARNLGLMHRRSLPPDQGMLFLFPEERVHSFWMRDTPVALDMIFIDGRREVVGVVENATPFTDTPRLVWKPSRYVVEVNAHLARVSGIREGTKVRFEGVVSPLFDLGVKSR